MHERGLGTAQDLPRAVALLRQAVARDFAPAKVRLARLLLEGRAGVALQNDADLEAYQLLEQAARQGDPAGMAGHGKLLLSGVGGRRNVMEGVEWLEKAVARGDEEARQALRAFRGE
jgi:TPR repeat protein